MSFSLVLATAAGLCCSPSSAAYSLTSTSLYCRIRELWNQEPKIRKRKLGVSETERMSTITKGQKGLFLNAGPQHRLKVTKDKQFSHIVYFKENLSRIQDRLSL
jgi:hypothetical protein